jgi:hypothetical protein
MMLQRMSLLMAHLGRANHPPSGPLLEVFLPRLHIVGEAVDDPSRSLLVKICCDAQHLRCDIPCNIGLVLGGGWKRMRRGTNFAAGAADPA